jgi:ribosome maturation factor RimP|tara:strand:+ start:246 stop:692 length:447 start_codon:yes stop_codon:yes gene_type:complete
MHIQNQNLLDLFEPEITAMGFELLGIELIKNGHISLLRVYIDKFEGVNIDDCVLVSQQLTGLLDVKDPIKGQYNLEVSSPGIDRPLFTDEQLKKHIGHIVMIKLREKYRGKRKITGVLEAVDNLEIIIKCNENNEKIPSELIDKAKLA